MALRLETQGNTVQARPASRPEKQQKTTKGKRKKTNVFIGADGCAQRGKDTSHQISSGDPGQLDKEGMRDLGK